MIFKFLKAQHSISLYDSRPYVNVSAEVARIFGTDCTPNGLRFQFTDRFKPVAKRQLDMLAAGEDPKDINLEDCKPTKGGKGQKF